MGRVIWIVWNWQRFCSPATGIGFVRCWAILSERIALIDQNSLHPCIRWESRFPDPLEFLCSRVELTSVPGGQNAMAHLKKRKLEAESVSPNPKQPQQPQQQQPHYQQQQPLINKKAVQAIIPQEMETADAAAKRRRKSVRDEETRKSLEASDSSKSIPLPQKKRAFAAGNSGSPARKSSKHSEEPEDDETLIRETEAALKSLSGSWPGPRGSLYQRGNSDEDKYESNFENLFEEKKDNPKLSPSSMSTSSTTSNDAGCSLKDVISFRGQQDRNSKSQQQLKQQDMKQQQHPSKAKKDLDSLLKTENECGIIQNQVNNVNPNESGKIRPVPMRSLSNKDRNDRNIIGTHVDSQGRQTDKYSRYDPPDFNELVDDSSNELEIDMSDPAAEKDEADRDKLNERDRDRTCRNGQSPQNSRQQQQHQNQLYSNYHRHYNENSMKVSPTATTTSSSSPPSNSPFSATSAFRPPNTDHAKATGRGTPSVAVASTAIPPIGPYPASATFVGYPTAGPGPTMPTPQPVTGISTTSEDKHSSSVSLLQLKSSKEEVHHVTRHEVAPNSMTGNKSPTSGLPAITSPDSSKQYTILQPAGIGSRAASAIQDIAREGVVSVTAVSSCSTTNGNTANGINSNSNGTCTNNIPNKSTNNNSSGNANNTANPVSNGNGNNVTNSIAITAISTSTTTSSSTTGADATSGSGTGQQETVMKMAERPVTFDGTRPGMSMSPSSLNRGERFNVLFCTNITDIFDIYKLVFMKNFVFIEFI